MPITFKSERRKVLKNMYYDMVDAYVDELSVNKGYTKEEKADKKEDAAVWKQEFKELIEDL